MNPKLPLGCGWPSRSAQLRSSFLRISRLWTMPAYWFEPYTNYLVYRAGHKPGCRPSLPGWPTPSSPTGSQASRHSSDDPRYGAIFIREGRSKGCRKPNGSRLTSAPETCTSNGNKPDTGQPFRRRASPALCPSVCAGRVRHAYTSCNRHTHQPTFQLL
jgi:hypothetical protein